MNVDAVRRVWVVDDDADVRGSLELLLETSGFETRLFESAEQLLATIEPQSRGCLLLDVRLPGIDGLALQAELKQRAIDLPIVFMSGHGDIPMAVRAVNAGALDFIEKPFSDDRLIELLTTALNREAARHAVSRDRRELEHRLDRLTPREREVLEGLVDGKLSKQIAADLDISPRTVELHRARVLKKMEVANAAELVRLLLDTRS
ncbi:MAG: response regulator [Wenzhouxiangellaceae bacterium]|nr:response regulator [Wenzhouxiangellaceae bacterium]